MFVEDMLAFVNLVNIIIMRHDLQICIVFLVWFEAFHTNAALVILFLLLLIKVFLKLYLLSFVTQQLFKVLLTKLLVNPFLVILQAIHVVLFYLLCTV